VAQIPAGSHGQKQKLTFAFGGQNKILNIRYGVIGNMFVLRTNALGSIPSIGIFWTGVDQQAKQIFISSCLWDLDEP
jgi:hypothetical protein